MALSYADLKAKSEQKAKDGAVPFVAKDGKEVLLRPLFQLTGVELKNVLAHVDVLQKEKKKAEGEQDEQSLQGMIDRVDHILICVSDRKRAMKASLDDLDVESRMAIFEEYMKDAEAPEASDSTS